MRTHDTIRAAVDKIQSDIDTMVRHAFEMNFGAGRENELPTHGLVKHWPNRDEYFFKDLHFATVWKPVNEVNRRTPHLQMKMEYRIEVHLVEEDGHVS